MVMEAVFAKLFASISTIKAAYAQLQIAQSPYDPEEIQVADELVVTELKLLSELKQSYLKKQNDSSPHITVLLAELKEQKSVLKSYEIMRKKLDSQFKLKDSEILFLKEKLEECGKQNELLEQQLDHFDSFSVLDNVELSELSYKHFAVVHQRVVESICSFVKLVIEKMCSSGWDIGAAANAIEPGMSLNEQECRSQRRFFDKFMELKSINAMEMLKVKPGSSFGKFCRVKYLGLVHPKMEGCRFSEVLMENVVEHDTDELPGSEPRVGFTVIPGFNIGKKTGVTMEMRYFASLNYSNTRNRKNKKKQHSRQNRLTRGMPSKEGKIPVHVIAGVVGKWRETYRWIPIFGGFIAFAMAFCAGANNISVPFSTVVGSGTLTLIQASVAAFLIYVPGTAFASNSSLDVLLSDFLKEKQPNEGFLMWSLVAVLITATIWLAIATYLELPVSAQQSTQGALLGTMLVTEGIRYLPTWNKSCLAS
ncbi:hypothetical protein IFM89_038380 [Coptis chinensis]|uniref:Phosphate transporter n=1 Tax=Coptis chinensis TaxID=261450 RepID=A0A835H526_9MAGN|nr:hypothetical protein IFM89_038380 [Coptis chinensis]